MTKIHIAISSVLIGLLSSCGHGNSSNISDEIKGSWKVAKVACGDGTDVTTAALGTSTHEEVFNGTDHYSAITEGGCTQLWSIPVSYSGNQLQFAPNKTVTCFPQPCSSTTLLSTVCGQVAANTALLSVSVQLQGGSLSVTDFGGGAAQTCSSLGHGMQAILTLSH